MAISSGLRRAPWAAARGLLASRSGWRVQPPQTQPQRAECSALLSSISAPQPGAAADAQLLRVINYEISCAQQDCKKRDWVCDPAISLFPLVFYVFPSQLVIGYTNDKPKLQLQIFRILKDAGDMVLLEILCMVAPYFSFAIDGYV
jgi:hypothetical protein